jgi:sugar lactone lactonase YvrE
VADAIGKRIARVARGGKILEQIDTGEFGIFAAALGGPDGRTLFMAAAPDFIEANRRAKPEGRILTTRVDVPHAGRP